MSDLESDAPETVTLSQSARTARRREKNLEAFTAVERQKAKDKNRKRDERLKQQAAARKEKGKGSAKGKGRGRAVKDSNSKDEETQRLEMRMARAMEEAEDEDEDGGDGDEFVGFALDRDEGDEYGMDEGDGMDGDRDEEEIVDEEYEVKESDDEGDREADEDLGAAQLAKSTYLPEDLFAPALSQKTSHSSNSASSPSAQPRKKQRRAVRKSKDILVGDRIVRTLATTSTHRTSATTAVSFTPSAGATTPHARINRFLNRTLALKGREHKGQRWERKPVNLGIFKNNDGAPLTGFVRPR
ncbi:hypothetical protein K488DRAFT_90545 [Vararia minispora EC-137]|uniref:Uncharacterized protein n=1 Tax=Vararia minispora EC-137 TaxID=1314806 RepID=A0ACB8Q7E7_9AGAM|nr:hypothetical protein K488DRAFT_90545 [Vararia minispora EC-137]